MKKIKIFANSTNSINLLNRILESYDWENDSKYGVEYKFTKDDDFTHVILMNFIMPDISINKENIIGLAQEPGMYLPLRWYHKNYYCKKVKKYFIGSTRYINSSIEILTFREKIKEYFILFCLFFVQKIKEYFYGYTPNNSSSHKLPFIEKMSYQLPHISYKIVNKYIENFPKKTKLINYVYSDKYKNKTRRPCLYGYRNEVGNAILQNNLEIDIYGSSTNKLKEIFGKKENIKHSFHWNEVHKIYEKYKFSIVIENTIEPEYFSEKIIIPLLCGCIPIYLGCTNIDNYFKDYVIHLSGNINNDLNLIKTILDNPDKYYKKINIESIKEKIHLKNIIHQEFL